MNECDFRCTRCGTGTEQYGLCWKCEQESAPAAEQQDKRRRDVAQALHDLQFGYTETAETILSDMLAVGFAPSPAPAAEQELLRTVRPVVVCLCGSTRFYDAFQRANFAETMAGKIVLSVGFFAGSPEAMAREHGEGVGITPDEKVMLDDLHKRKIDLADEILVLNVGDYVGSSTQSELDYAVAKGKRIRWLEPTARSPSPDVTTPSGISVAAKPNSSAPSPAQEKPVEE